MSYILCHNSLASRSNIKIVLRSAIALPRTVYLKNAIAYQILKDEKLFSFFL